MNSLCQITSIFHQDQFWLIATYILTAIVTLSLLIWVIRLIYHIQENKLRKISYAIISAVASVVFFIVFSVTTVIILFLAGLIHDDYPPSANYHVLNAAIKNTCFLDPLRNHCPQTVQDIISIEPENFTKLTKDANLTYEYYPETNQYTLIIRNNNYWINDNRVVIFDPRLATAKDYGHGVDFIDTHITACNGKYTLTNPPPFPGPWDQIY